MVDDPRRHAEAAGAPRLGRAIAQIDPLGKGAFHDRVGPLARADEHEVREALPVLEAEPIAGRVEQRLRFGHLAQVAVQVIEILERRLDNVVRRSNFARSIWQARQMVNHGHITVNGSKVDIASFQVSPGDVVSIRPTSKEWIGRNVELQGGEVRTEWLTLNKEALEVKVIDKPKTAALPFDFQVGMIIEFYS